MNQLKNATILVVDDEALLREAIRFELEMEGAIVQEAGGGREAIKLVREGSFHLVLSDIRMAEGDGVELLKNIKKLNPMTPVVMLITGFADFTADEAHQQGCAGFVSKPFDPEELVKLIVRALKTHPNQWAQKVERKRSSTEVTLSFPSLTAAVQSKTLNISKGGMFVVSSGPFPEVGSLLRFKLAHPEDSSQSLEGEGLVRWIRSTAVDGRPAGYGIEFFNLEEATVKRLSQLVDQLPDKVPFIPAA